MTPEFDAAIERGEAKARREGYLEHFKLRAYAKGYRNVLKILKQGGAPAERCREVAEKLCGNCGTYGSLSGWHAFDHGEVLGRDGEPCRLMGYPYQLDDDGLRQLEAIRSLGLEVFVHSRSNYGFGSLQVEVFAPKEMR